MRPAITFFNIQLSNSRVSSLVFHPNFPSSLINHTFLPIQDYIMICILGYIPFLNTLPRKKYGFSQHKSLFIMPL